MATRIAVITGASSGIGAACATTLKAAGFDVILGARRIQQLKRIGDSVGALSRQLDVTDPESVNVFLSKLPHVDLLVNNAGGALGVDPIESANDDDWRIMWETNVLGLVRMTRSCLPALRAAPAGHIVNIGSIAGFETYVGGAGYTSVKHAVRAVTRTLRVELLGEPIRVTEICPGLVETDFSLVRFKGDRKRAEAVYRGMTPLLARDIADCVTWAATRPSHVNIDEIVVRPLDQATATAVSRNAE